MLKVQTMSRIFKHHDVIICNSWEKLIVKRSVVQNFSLERIRSVEQKAASLESLLEFGKAVYIFFILKYRI